MCKLIKFSFVRALRAAQVMAIIAVAMSACSKKKDGVDVDIITPEPYTVAVNGTLTFVAKVTPASAAKKEEVTIKSDNPGIAEVTNTTIQGSEVTMTVKGVSAGKTTISVTHNKTGLSDFREVTVTPIAGTLTVAVSGTYTYTGAAITPSGTSVTVKHGETTLTAGTHYTLEYSNNINVGTATVTAKGTGNYAGSSGSGTFTITPLASGTFAVTVAGDYTYTGAGITPETVTVKAGEKTLTATTDYTLAYSDNINAGTETAKVTTTGVGNYAGSSGSGTFTIKPRAVNVTANNMEKIFGEADPTLTYTATPALIAPDVFTGELTRESGDDAGTYAITQGTLTAGGNYTINFTPGVFTISFFAGKGTVNEPYIIDTPQKLAKLAELVNEGTAPFANAGIYYKMTTEINLSDYGTGYNSGKGWIPIGTKTPDRPFRGNFDGNNLMVSGLYINDANLNEAGLFGYMMSGSIQNLGVDGVVNAKNNIGGIVGCCYIGSVVTINKCHSATTIIGKEGVGGIAGLIQSTNCTVSRCYATGAISGSMFVGGLVGWARANIIDCYTTGTARGAQNVGGVVGDGGSIIRCYTTGALEGGYYVGGMVGGASGRSVSNCASLNPSLTYTSSLSDYFHRVGRDFYETTNVAWEGMQALGGVTFGNSSWNNGTDISTAQAKDKATYEALGWKFGNDDDNPWKMGVGTYPLPVFYWQTSAPKADIEHLK